MATTASAEERVFDDDMKLVAGLLVAATIYDIETTVAGLDRCKNCSEGNPFARAVVANGRPAMYAVGLASDFVLVYAAYKLKERGYSWWWALPAAGIAVHGLAGTMNLRFVLR
jgi:hypothetical protein